MREKLMQARIRQEVVDAATAIIDGRLDLVRGCRKLNHLCRGIEPYNQKIFLSITGFESETDDYPLDDVRQHYDEKHLAKLDQEMLEYCDRARSSILGACRLIVAEYSEES